MRSDPDALAESLLHMGAVATLMGPSWDKAGMSHPFVGQDGEHLGRILPGRGLYLDVDLKHLGITRRIPGVFTRSRFQRVLERLHGDERGAITSYANIITQRGNGLGEDIFLSKSSITTASGFWYDTFRAGGNPAAGSYLATTAPTDRADDKTTVGAFSSWLTNPSGSNKKYLLAVGAAASSAHNFAILVDQLTSSGSFRLTVTTAETIASPTAVTRQYGPSANLGAGAQAIFSVITARTTPTTSTLTISYRDQGNNAHTSAPAMLANADPVDRLLALPSAGSPFAVLASGDFGVRRLDATTKAASADAAGVVAGQVVQPLMFVPLVAANVFVERDAPSNIEGFLELANASQVLGCLKLLVYAGAASLGALLASLRTVEG